MRLPHKRATWKLLRSSARRLRPDIARLEALCRMRRARLDLQSSTAWSSGSAARCRHLPPSGPVFPEDSGSQSFFGLSLLVLAQLQQEAIGDLNGTVGGDRLGPLELEAAREAPRASGALLVAAGPSAVRAGAGGSRAYLAHDRSPCLPCPRRSPGPAGSTSDRAPRPVEAQGRARSDMGADFAAGSGQSRGSCAHPQA